MRILIKSIGFIGDNIFATSVADKLKIKYPNSNIDFILSILAPYELIYNNPNINRVLVSDKVSETEYDLIYKLNPINRKTTPCEQFQKMAEINNPESNYKVYTNPAMDSLLKQTIDTYRNNGKIVIGYQLNWQEKSFLFTQEQYKQGIGVPNLGYGGKHRDTDKIINLLKKSDKLELIPIGKPVGFNQSQTDIQYIQDLTYTASLIKNLDYFIGAEGGLSNIAAGVGTKTIITGDFVHQLYGWNGVIEKNDEPKLGPKYYGFDEEHITLDPYLTDIEVVDKINELIKEI